MAPREESRLHGEIHRFRLTEKAGITDRRVCEICSGTGGRRGEDSLLIITNGLQDPTFRDDRQGSLFAQMSQDGNPLVSPIPTCYSVSLVSSRLQWNKLHGSLRGFGAHIPFFGFYTVTISQFRFYSLGQGQAPVSSG